MPGGPVATGGGVGAHVEPKSKLSGILMAGFAAFGGILFGYDTGTISGVKEMQVWKCTFGNSSCNISSSQESLVVSILSLGTFFGALIGAPVADNVGRQYGVVVACVVFTVGVVMQLASSALPLFVVGRVFAGLGVGIVSTIIPMYQSECAPKWIRGTVVAAYQWAITIGLLLASIVNNSTQNRSDSGSWRIPTGIQLAWGIILSAGMIYLPESPRYLVKRGRMDKAAAALARLTATDVDDPALQLELADIQANLDAEMALGQSSYADCFAATSNRIRFRTLTGIFLQAWQQLTGINFIFYYGTTFFKASGIQDPFLITIATNVVNVGMTVPGMWGVERFGRRSLLIWGAVVMCLCEYLVAIIGMTISTNNHAGQQALIALVCIYIAAFASTWGPIAWVITGEIFPLAIRAKAMSMATASNWLWNFALGYATPYLVNDGPGNAGLGVKVFWIWGSTCLFCIVFAYFCIPETKGLTLEQVDILYKNTTPVRSVSYRRERLMEDVHAAEVEGKRGGGGGAHNADSVSDEKRADETREHV